MTVIAITEVHYNLLCSIRFILKEKTIKGMTKTIIESNGTKKRFSEKTIKDACKKNKNDKMKGVHVDENCKKIILNIKETNRMPTLHSTVSLLILDYLNLVKKEELFSPPRSYGRN